MCHRYVCNDTCLEKILRRNVKSAKGSYATLLSAGYQNQFNVLCLQWPMAFPTPAWKPPRFYVKVQNARKLCHITYMYRVVHLVAALFVEMLT